MAKKGDKSVRVQKEVKAVINDWSRSEAKEFLLKGGLIQSKVTNYDKNGNITSYCITEKQVAPNYRLHLNTVDPEPEDDLEKLKRELE